MITVITSNVLQKVIMVRMIYDNIMQRDAMSVEIVIVYDKNKG